MAEDICTKQCEYILSVGTCLCILFNTTCMYIMYKLNVSVCVNEFVFSFVYSLC